MKKMPLLLILVACSALASCNEETSPAKPPRPVLSTVVRPVATGNVVTVGTIEPQFKTELSFRSLGRLVARPVGVGDRVEKDQVVAAIDDASLKLAVRSAVAEVANAQSQLANASGVEDRQRTLLETASTSRATFETSEQGRAAAQASMAKAQANLVKAREQLGYAQLKADFAGVVTTVGAEVGQVVAPGERIVTVARPDVREAVIDVGEDLVGELRIGTPFNVSLRRDASVTANGKVREIAPQADAATRTRRIRIGLDQPPDSFRLGTTITAKPAVVRAIALFVPAGAVFDRDGKTFVWRVEASSQTVVLQHVQVADVSDGRRRVISGVEAGMRVVTAGIHSLSDGQKVRIEQEAQP